MQCMLHYSLVMTCSFINNGRRDGTFAESASSLIADIIVQNLGYYVLQAPTSTLEDLMQCYTMCTIYVRRYEYYADYMAS